MAFRSASSPGSAARPSASAASRRAPSQSPVCHATMPRSTFSVAEVLRPLGLDPFERGLGAWDVARREAGARLLGSQRGHALRGRDRDRLGIGGGGAGLAGPVEQLRPQRKERRALALVRVLERQLGPLGAVAVGPHARGPLGSLREERHGLARVARAQQVVRHRLGRRVVRRRAARQHSAWVRRSASSGSRAASSSRTSACRKR